MQAATWNPRCQRTADNTVLSWPELTDFLYDLQGVHCSAIYDADFLPDGVHPRAARGSDALDAGTCRPQDSSQVCRPHHRNMGHDPWPDLLEPLCHAPRAGLLAAHNPVCAGRQRQQVVLCVLPCMWSIAAPERARLMCPPASEP